MSSASAGARLARGRKVKSEIVLAARPSAACWGRHYARAVLRGWHLDAELVWTAELLVSELVTNAVRCSGPRVAGSRYTEPDDPSRVHLSLRYLPRHLIIEVTDPDPRLPVLAEAGPQADGGRGLVLIDALSASWNFVRRPAGGKTVFCVLELARSPVDLGMADGPGDGVAR